MIGYVTVGTNNLEDSAKFYDPFFSSIELSRKMEATDFIAWGGDDQGPMFSIHIPADGKEMSIGNGTMIGLILKNKNEVEKAYHKAIELGGSCEGAPGYRQDGFYAAYFRDLDGNKLNVHCFE